MRILIENVTSLAFALPYYHINFNILFKKGLMLSCGCLTRKNNQILDQNSVLTLVLNPLFVHFSSPQDVASECEVKCMPTFQFFKKGQKVGTSALEGECGV